MNDNKLQLMKEERIRRFKKLIGLNEEIEQDYSSAPEGAAICPPPIAEDGMAQPAAEAPAMDPKLDELVSELTLAVPHMIMRYIQERGLAKGHDAPYMAAYVMKNLVGNLSQEV